MAKPHKHGPFRILDEAEVPVAALADDPGNANLHSEDNLAAIQASIEAFGQVERLIARKSDRTVYAGNGRLEVLRRLGRKKARIQWVEGTDEQCRAYAIASNQTTRMSRFDDKALAEQLAAIHDADLGGLFPATGFTLEDLEDLKHLADEALHGVGKDLPAGQGGSLATCPHCGKTFQVGGGK